jgi:hypothetical protein
MTQDAKQTRPSFIVQLNVVYAIGSSSHITSDHSRLKRILTGNHTQSSALSSQAHTDSIPAVQHQYFVAGVREMGLKRTGGGWYEVFAASRKHHEVVSTEDVSVLTLSLVLSFSWSTCMFSVPNRDN